MKQRRFATSYSHKIIHRNGADFYDYVLKNQLRYSFFKKEGIALNQITKKYINDLTQQIILIYDITVPINDLETIVSRMGGTIYQKDNFDTFRDGTVQKCTQDTFQITIAKNQQPQAEIFAIAHELGHLFLHMGFKINPSLWHNQTTAAQKFISADQIYQANEFAASLLMPITEYTNFIRKSAVDNKINMAKIANHFNVSIANAVSRGISLNLLHN